MPLRWLQDFRAFASIENPRRGGACPSRDLAESHNRTCHCEPVRTTYVAIRVLRPYGLKQGETDSHTSDIGHWLGMTGTCVFPRFRAFSGFPQPPQSLAKLVTAPPRGAKLPPAAKNRAGGKTPPARTIHIIYIVYYSSSRQSHSRPPLKTEAFISSESITRSEFGKRLHISKKKSPAVLQFSMQSSVSMRYLLV